MRAQLSSLCTAAILVAAFLGCSPVTRDLGNTGSGGKPSSTSSTGGKGTGATGSGASGSGASGTGGMGTGGGAMTPPIVDGSRLKAVVLDGGKGAVGFEHWQDTQLGAPCQFIPTTDGNYHCAPIQHNTIAYADASCTMKVAVQATCGTPSTYVVDQQNGTCEQVISNVSYGAPATIYSIGAMQGTGQVYTLQGNPPSCYPSNTSDYYTITVADLSTFVGATLKKEARGPRLDAEFLEADDGSKQMTGQMYDEKMGGAACTLDASGDPNNPSFFCIPGAVAEIQPNQTVYDDPTCMTQVAEEYGANGMACPAAKVIVSYPPNQSSCSLGTATFYATGNDVTAGNICQMDASSGACNCKTDTSGNHYYKVGAKLDASTFAPLGFGKLGTGRLRAIALTTPAGEQLTAGFPSTFWDTMSGPTGGESCYIRPFSDGTSRCVPNDAFTLYTSNQPVYADAACTQQLIQQYNDPSCPVKPPSSIVALTSAQDVCSQDTVTAVYALGMPFNPNGTVYYANPTCSSTTADSSSTYYTIGSTVDPSTLFASVTETMQ